MNEDIISDFTPNQEETAPKVDTIEEIPTEAPIEHVPKEITPQDQKFANIEKLKNIIGEQREYIRKNQLDFIAPKLNGRQMMQMTNSELEDKITEEKEDLNEMIENHEYEPDDEEMLQRAEDI